MAGIGNWWQANVGTYRVRIRMLPRRSHFSPVREVRLEGMRGLNRPPEGRELAERSHFTQ